MATEEIIPGFSAVPVDGAVVQNLTIKEEEEQEKALWISNNNKNFLLY